MAKPHFAFKFGKKNAQPQVNPHKSLLKPMQHVPLLVESNSIHQSVENVPRIPFMDPSKHSISSKASTFSKNKSRPQNYVHSRYSITSQDRSVLISADAKPDQKFIHNPKSKYCTENELRFRRKHYGLCSCIKIVVSTCLASGIFTTPNSIFMEVNNQALALIIWFVYGCVAVLGGLVYAELGATFPVSAGDYAYMNESFGPFFGFLFQWSANIVFVPCINAVLAYVIAYNLVSPFSDFTDPYYFNWATALMAIAVILLASYLVSVSPRLADEIRTFVFILKAIVLGVIVLSGIYYVSSYGAYQHTHFDLSEINDPSMKQNQTALASEIFKAIYQASFSYLSLNILNYVAEDITHPSRTIPIAICISMPLVLGTYLVVIFFYSVVLKADVLISSNIIASEMVEAILPESVQHYVEAIVPAFIAIAISGTILFRMIVFSRVTFVGCRMGHMPKILSLVSVTSRFPVVTVFFLAILSCGYVLLIAATDLETFVIFPTNVEIFFVALSSYALIYMRIRRPEIQRPFKLPLFIPIIFAMICTTLFFTPIIILIIDTAQNNNDISRMKKYTALLGGALFVIVTGIPLYFIFIRRKIKVRFLTILHNYLFVLAQKVFVALPEPQKHKHL